LQRKIKARQVYARSVNDNKEYRALPKDKRVKNSCIAVGFKIG
jgi:hypothetical protein